jgi:hypothetical protein
MLALPSTLSAQSNWDEIRNSTMHHGVPEYDPSAPFSMTFKQSMDEERRAWSDNLSAMAGSPWTRQRSGLLGSPTLRKQLPPLAPPLNEEGGELEQVTHWRTGQKTMLDRNAMKMFVIGVQ